MTFVAGTVLTAAALNSELAAKTDTAMTQLTPGSSPYAMVLADAGRLVTPNSASANQVTVTKQATVAWVTATQLRVMNLGAGVTTLVADTGVTINNNKALAQYQGGTLIRTASDVWTFQPNASTLNTASAVKLDTFSTASTTFVDVTGMSVTITPSSTAAKVLVIVTLGLVANGSTAVTRFNLVRGSTTIAQPTGGTTPSTVNFLLEATGVSIPGPISFVDSPASAAATTYKLQMAATASTSYINRRAAGGFETISHIFAMEVPA